MDAHRVPVHQLTTAQRRVLEWIDRYATALEEPCPASFVARRMDLHRSTVEQHIAALHRKGWLVTAKSPTKPAAPVPR